MKNKYKDSFKEERFVYRTEARRIKRGSLTYVTFDAGFVGFIKFRTSKAVFEKLKETKIKGVKLHTPCS